MNNLITLTKCNCGHKACDYHGTSDGKFPQGSGYDKKTAELHALAVNVHDELVTMLKDIHPQIQSETWRRAVGNLIVKVQGA